MQRERKRKETHDIRPHKYRAWFAEGDGSRLPEPVFALARRMQDCWTDIALHNQDAYDEWRMAHPAPAAPAGLEGQTIEKWRRENWPKLPKPYYEGNQAWAESRVRQANLPGELGQTILDRLSVTFKNMKKGGGPPKPHYRLDRFAFHHRYTSGGLPVLGLRSQRSQRFHILLPSPHAYQTKGGTKNPRELRRQRVCPAWFCVDGVSARLNVMMHRPLPEGDAYVKRVALVGKKSSAAMPWEVSLALTVEVPVAKEPQAPAGTRCGLDVGWRKLDKDRMRVAVLYNGGPNSEELVMPLRIHDRKLGEVSLERLARLNRCRDALLERTKAAVATMLGTEPSAWAQMRNGGLVRLMREDGAPPEVPEAWKQDNDRYLRIERMVADRLRRHYDWMVLPHMQSLAGHDFATAGPFRPGQHYLVIHLFVLTLADYNFLPLPDSRFSLYYALRSLRVTCDTAKWFNQAEWKRVRAILYFGFWTNDPLGAQPVGSGPHD